MTSHRKINVAVFFTHGVSLALWDARGMFSREVRFYEELAREVGEVWFFTYGRDDAQYRDRLDDRIRIFPKRLPVPNLLYAAVLPFLYRRELARADAIRIHQMAGAIPALLAHWMTHKPLIVRAGYQWSKFLERTGASKIKRWAVTVIEKVAYDFAASIIVTTQEDLEYVARLYGIDSAKLNLIPNYVDTDLFKPMRVEKQPHTVCFVGRLEEQKNLLALVEAMRGVDGELVLYGEGFQRKELEDAAREHGVDVEFRGRIANEKLPTALNTCTIFVLPSLYEGNPKVLLEAMACGLPVVGTDVEGIASIIQHEKTGLLCGTQPDAIRQTINRLMDDPELRSRLGEAAREAIIQSSSLEQVIQKEAILIPELDSDR